MKNNIFLDTSGFYALLAKRDEMHEKAAAIMHEAANKRIVFTTTDYILDETATLLVARGLSHLVQRFFTIVFESSACSIVWMEQSRFAKTQQLFIKHRSNQWSFTDCFSFVVMKELKLTDSLTKDGHFRAAGFKPLLVQK
ncbi:MAG: type II toxin-antitoxin system VapC family toxin [Chitinivibrionales bacterium]|nr:type II toxin-antitoxin system VapC family toxin [Chitinivibrionales bacterium]